MPEDVPRDLTDQAVRDLRVLFAAFQETERSIISMARLADIVELLGEPRPDLSRLQAIIASLYPGGASASGRVIDFKMFLRFFVTHLFGGNVPVRSREIFSAFDSDTNASVSAAELQESLTIMGMPLNEEEALAMTSVIDGAVDGEVNYYEFKQICRIIESEIAVCPSAQMRSLKPNDAVWANRFPITSPDTTPSSMASKETPENGFRPSPVNQ